jgi:hypothetical protein
MGKRKNDYMEDELPEFIKLPIKVTDKEKKDLTGVIDYYKSWLKVNARYIVCYAPQRIKSDDGEMRPAVHLYLAMGAFLVDMPIKEFDKLLDDYREQSKKAR